MGLICHTYRTELPENKLVYEEVFTIVLLIIQVVQLVMLMKTQYLHRTEEIILQIGILDLEHTHVIQIILLQEIPQYCHKEGTTI